MGRTIPPVRVAIATFKRMPPGFRDDEWLAEALEAMGAEAERIPWDDPVADWSAFDLVVIRSTWDYTERRDEFVAWADSIGSRLHNSPELVRWNSDKHYLGDLASAGLPIVHTTYAEPGEPPPELDGEVVVKPAVSGGARDSGRFSERTHEEAAALIERINRSGRTAMIQPYMAAVDSVGETAVVFIDGEPSHALRKRAVLRPDEVAPVREGGAAEVMYDPELVTAHRATEAELEFAGHVVEHVAERFGYVPLYGRVDTVSDGASPVLMELEVIEPGLYLDQAPPETVGRVAAAILGRA
jgi:glutathione synthase/RimK-type ligase-like ATP-grasp enzyme